MGGQARCSFNPWVSRHSSAHKWPLLGESAEGVDAAGGGGHARYTSPAFTGFQRGQGRQREQGQKALWGFPQRGVCGTRRDLPPKIQSHLFWEATLAVKPAFSPSRAAAEGTLRALAEYLTEPRIQPIAHASGVRRTALWIRVSPGNPGPTALFSDVDTGYCCVVQASLELVPTPSPESASRDMVRLQHMTPF